MTRQDALRMLEKTLAMSPHTLTGGEDLGEIAAWDSLSTLEFICTVDKIMGLPLRGNQVARCQTVEELIGLLGIAPDARAA